MIRLFALILLMWPASSFAETSTIRTGWHPTFTRIVLSLSPGSEWNVGRLEDAIAVEIAGITDYETEGFFARLPRERIVGVAGDEQRLVLEMGCNCHATAYLWRPDRLVVDIREGPAPEDNRFNDALEPDPTPEPEIALDLLPIPKPRITLDDISPIAEAVAPRPDLSELENRIFQSLSRAADQGLLELSDGASAQTFNNDEATPQATTKPVAKPAAPPPVPLVNSGISARTSLESGLGLNEVASLFEDISGAKRCWPDSYVNVASWAPGQGYAEDISLARREIYGEFDRVDHAAVTNLARTFLYYGFGREADQTLLIDAELSAERTAIKELSLIMDDEGSAAQTIAEQLHCEGLVAMWAMLATEIKNLDQHNDTDRLVRQFRALPEHLRIHLAGRMAARLASLGEVDAAENLLAVGPLDTRPPIENVVVAAELAIERGDVGEATTSLQKLAETDERLTPQALATLINLQIDQDLQVDPTMLSLLESKRFQFRDDPIDLDLARVELRAQLHLDDFASARETLRETVDRGGSYPVTEMAGRLTEAITKQPDDMVFLEFAFSNEVGNASSDAVNLVATRLLDLGFPERARILLRPQASGDAMAERRYLRAQAARALGDDTAAADALLGVNTPRANAILNGVSFSSGRQEEDQESNTELLAWRTENWSSLAVGEDRLLREASALILQNSDPTPDLETPLTTGRQLIERSGETRGTLNDLLDRFEAPDSAAAGASN